MRSWIEIIVELGAQLELRLPEGRLASGCLTFYNLLCFFFGLTFYAILEAFEDKRDKKEDEKVLFNSKVIHIRYAINTYKNM